MVPKIACPRCGEQNYETSPACWACGAPLKGPRAEAAKAANSPGMPETVPAPPGMTAETAEVETLLEAAPDVTRPLDAPPASPAPPHPPAPLVPPGMTAEEAQVDTLLEAVPDATEPAPPPAPAAPAGAPANGPERRPKPAELEAAALREKAYVTPPVDVDERPRSVGDWISYVFQAIAASTSGFREALDEYDRRRGHRSGTMSSYGCLMSAVVAAICIAIIVWIVSLLARTP